MQEIAHRRRRCRVAHDERRIRGAFDERVLRAFALEVEELGFAVGRDAVRLEQRLGAR